MHPDLARKWIIGEEPATYSNQTARQTTGWFDDMSVWWLHERLNAAQAAVDRARAALDRSERIGDVERTDQTRAELGAALEALEGVLGEFRRAGLTPPRLAGEES